MSNTAQGRALAILDAADAAGDRRTALAAIREARGGLELVAQLTGELRERVVTEDENRVCIAEWGKSDPPPLHARPAAIDVTPPALPTANRNGS